MDYGSFRPAVLGCDIFLPTNFIIDAWHVCMKIDIVQ